MITRRRFLAIAAFSAGSIGALTGKADAVWRGRAFGADISIALHGPDAGRDTALAAARDTISRIEHLFSIYDPGSQLSVLNRTGRLTMPPEFARLVQIADRVHAQSDGLFDPTIQPLFAAKLRVAGSGQALGEEIWNRIGWRHVRFDDREIAFTQAGMSITFNGIAQGFATDRVAETLSSHGYDQAVVNIGEYRVGDRAAAIGVANQAGDMLAELQLKNQAVATTASDGFMFADGSGHILAPGRTDEQPAWKTVSVVADTAAVADGMSTALALSPDDQLALRLVKGDIISTAIMQRLDGKVVTRGETL